MKLCTLRLKDVPLLYVGIVRGMDGGRYFLYNGETSWYAR